MTHAYINTGISLRVRGESTSPPSAAIGRCPVDPDGPEELTTHYFEADGLGVDVVTQHCEELGGSFEAL